MVHGIVGLDTDLQGSVAGMAAGGEGLGHVHCICLPAISQPAEADDRPYAARDLRGGFLSLCRGRWLLAI